jgi:magnesium transporter
MARRKAERKPKRRKKRPPRRALHEPAGTIVPDPEAPAPIVHVIGYGPQGCEEADTFDAAAIARLREKWEVTWVHVIGLGNGKLIEALGQQCGLHPLAISDVVHTHQRPKVEQWGDVTQVVVRMIDEAGSAETEQLSMFVGPGFLVSFEERKGDLFGRLRMRIRDNVASIRSTGADFLAYSLLDGIVDAFFPVLERISDELEDIEDDLPIGKPGEQAPRLRKAKHELLQMRHALWPLRDALRTLAQGPIELFTDETRAYLRDCQDHCAQLMDLVGSNRELAADLVDLHMSVQSQRMNEVMKVLTVMATVFIPLTFICSIYGMNFDTSASPYNMPELRWYFGYPFALGLMAATAGGLVFYFRRRGWI